jgi:hypothetical protein
MYRLATDNLRLIREADGAFIPVDLGNRDYQDALAWIAAGNAPTPYVAQPTQQDYGDAIESHLDAVAQSRGYSNADRLTSYVASANPAWSAEAAAFAAWRDAVWLYSYQQLALVQGGQRAAPTVTSFVAELPAISWPE